MAQKNKSDLKKMFVSQAIPTESNFSDLIDSVQATLVANGNIKLINFLLMGLLLFMMVMEFHFLYNRLLTKLLHYKVQFIIKIFPTALLYFL